MRMGFMRAYGDDREQLTRRFAFAERRVFFVRLEEAKRQSRRSVEFASGTAIASQCSMRCDDEVSSVRTQNDQRVVIQPIRIAEIRPTRKENPAG